MKVKEKINRVGLRIYCKGKTLLQSKDGNGELTGMLILVVIVVIIGGILLVAFKDQFTDLLAQVKTKTDEMFNYKG